MNASNNFFDDKDEILVLREQLWKTDTRLVLEATTFLGGVYRDMEVLNDLVDFVKSVAKCSPLIKSKQNVGLSSLEWALISIGRILGTLNEQDTQTDKICQHVDYLKGLATQHMSLNIDHLAILAIGKNKFIAMHSLSFLREYALALDPKNLLARRCLDAARGTSDGLEETEPWKSIEEAKSNSDDTWDP